MVKHNMHAIQYGLKVVIATYPHLNDLIIMCSDTEFAWTHKLDKTIDLDINYYNNFFSGRIQ